MSIWRTFFGFSDDEDRHETYDEAVARARHLLALRDYEGALRVFRYAEKEQHAEAIYWLACCYWNGWGIREDAGRALRLWKKSASLGFEPAQRKAEETGGLMVK